jgi:hypothetical protein
MPGDIARERISGCPCTDTGGADGLPLRYRTRRLERGGESQAASLWVERMWARQSRGRCDRCVVCNGAHVAAAAAAAVGVMKLQGVSSEMSLLGLSLAWAVVLAWAVILAWAVVHGRHASPRHQASLGANPRKLLFATTRPWWTRE